MYPHSSTAHVCFRFSISFDFQNYDAFSVILSVVTYELSSESAIFFVIHDRDLPVYHTMQILWTSDDELSDVVRPALPLRSKIFNLR